MDEQIPGQVTLDECIEDAEAEDKHESDEYESWGTNDFTVSDWAA